MITPFYYFIIYMKKRKWCNKNSVPKNFRKKTIYFSKIF